MKRLAKIGQKVTPVGRSAFVRDLKGMTGKVVDVLHGACGPILAIQFPQRPGVTVDLHWKKVQPVK